MRQIERFMREHLENMRPGSSIPCTSEFRDAWELQVSFEAGFRAAMNLAIQEYDKGVIFQTENLITRLKKLDELETS